MFLKASLRVCNKAGEGGCKTNEDCQYERSFGQVDKNREEDGTGKLYDLVCADNCTNDDTANGEVVFAPLRCCRSRTTEEREDLIRCNLTLGRRKCCGPSTGNLGGSRSCREGEGGCLHGKRHCRCRNNECPSCHDNACRVPNYFGFPGKKESCCLMNSADAAGFDDLIIPRCDATKKLPNCCGPDGPGEQECGLGEGVCSGNDDCKVEDGVQLECRENGCILDENSTETINCCMKPGDTEINFWLNGLDRCDVRRKIVECCKRDKWYKCALGEGGCTEDNQCKDGNKCLPAGPWALQTTYENGTTTSIRTCVKPCDPRLFAATGASPRYNAVTRDCCKNKNKGCTEGEGKCSESFDSDCGGRNNNADWKCGNKNCHNYYPNMKMENEEWAEWWAPYSETDCCYKA